MSIKPNIEKREFEIFQQNFKDGKFGSQRLGQAFHNHFGLHKMQSCKDKLDALYQKDGTAAIKAINELFEFN